MLKKPREGKGIPTFAMKKLGLPPTTPPPSLSGLAPTASISMSQVCLAEL